MIVPYYPRWRSRYGTACWVELRPGFVSLDARTSMTWRSEITALFGEMELARFGYLFEPEEHLIGEEP